jgi:hypothetical protein
VSWVWSLQLGLLESLQRGKVKTTQQEKWLQVCTETERDGFSEVDADVFLRERLVDCIP